MKVAKAGYYGGDPEKVLRGRVDHILALLKYEDYIHEYQDVYGELNK